MFQFTSGAGSPPGYRAAQATLSNTLSSNQHGPYPQPWSGSQGYQHSITAHSGVRRASEPAKSSQPCYNCGGFNHWAQDCPEPRRAVPAGAMNSQRPLKRQRTIGPVITKYPVPPTPTNFAANHSQLHPAQSGFTHPQSNAILQQYMHSTMGASTNSYPFNVRQQQNQLPNTLHRHPSQQWNSQGSLSPIPISPISSAGGAPTPDGFPPNNYVQHRSPAQTPPPRHGFSDKLHQGSMTNKRAPSSSQTDLNNQTQQSKASNSEPEEQVTESWWEELRALDYPEDSFEHRHVVSHPANPVAEALPSIMRDEDLVMRLPIAASLPAGTPVSKYFRNFDVERFMQNTLEVEESKDSEDPIMANLTEECENISKDELVARRQKLAALAEDAHHYGEEFRDDDLQTSTILEDAQDGGDSSDDVGDGLPTPSQSQESEEERQIREQEEKLAALGVTGFAKPVRTSIRRSVVPAAQPSPGSCEQLKASSLNTHRSAPHVSIEISQEATANSVSTNVLDGQRSNPLIDSDRKGYSRRESPSGSYHPANTLQTPPTSASHDSRYDNDQLYHRRSPSNSAQSSLRDLPANTNNIKPDSSESKTLDNVQRNHKDKDANLPSHIRDARTRDYKRRSPLEDHFNEHGDEYGNEGLVRKRPIRELSAEIDEGPKRQKDGCHSKDKRKAPKVAAAYGRRW